MLARKCLVLVVLHLVHLCAQVVLGFWPVLWDVVERRGRLNSHLMIDYSLAYMVFSIVLSLALGSIKGSIGAPGFPAYWPGSTIYAILDSTYAFLDNGLHRACLQAVAYRPQRLYMVAALLVSLPVLPSELIIFMNQAQTSCIMQNMNGALCSDHMNIL